MPATRLCRTDAGKLIDGLKDLSTLLENLGLEDGSVRLRQTEIFVEYLP